MADDAVLREKFARYQRTRDRALRNELIQEYRWIAFHCARRFDKRGEPIADLVQVGQIGVLKAVERFDPSMGVAFATFAMPTVMGELRRHFRDATWSVRVPRKLKDLQSELRSTVEFLTSTLGRPPRVDEIARRMALDEDEVLEIMEAAMAYRAGPLMATTEDEEPMEGEALAVEDADLRLAESRLIVRRLLRGLPFRERRIVYLRFFEGLSQSEIAEQVGVSQVHVSRLLRASLDQLKREISPASG